MPTVQDQLTTLEKRVVRLEKCVQHIIFCVKLVWGILGPVTTALALRYMLGAHQP